MKIIHMLILVPITLLLAPVGYVAWCMWTGLQAGWLWGDVNEGRRCGVLSPYDPQEPPNV